MPRSEPVTILVINEQADEIKLVTLSLRGFFPGFAYQLGVMFAASIPYLESYLGERFTYTQSMGGLVTAVFIIAFIVTALGPEAKGVSFRKEAGARG